MRRLPVAAFLLAVPFAAFGVGALTAPVRRLEPGPCDVALARYVSASARVASDPYGAVGREEAGAAYLASGCRIGSLLAARQAMDEAGGSPSRNMTVPLP